MKKVRKLILPNLCIILSVMILVFLCIDYFNSGMQFIDNEITKGLMFVLMALVITLAIKYMRALIKTERTR